MGSDPLGVGLSRDPKGLSADIFVEVNASIGRCDRLPFSFGQVDFARCGDEFWLKPICVIATRAIAPIVDDQEQFLGTLDLHIDRGRR